MKKLLTLGVLLCASVTTSAHASQIDIALGNTGASALIYTSGGSLNPNINLSTYSGLILSNADILAAGSNSATYSSPTGTLYGSTYVSVYGGTPGGLASFSLAGGNNVFSFTWSSVDTYNTLTLTDSRNVTYTITGADLVTQGLATVNVNGFGGDQLDVSIYDPYGTFVTAALSASQNSFEAANFGVSSVPLPATLPLFAFTIAGLIGLGRRKGKSATR